MAATVSMRVPTEAHQKLREMADKKHKPIGEVLNEAVELLEREQFWADYAAAYARLRADPEAWQEYRDELALWDSTLMDGLEDWPSEESE